jgi:site-specific recombinase XerD
MRKFAREMVDEYPSIARVSEAIAGQRRMGSEATVTGYVRGIKLFMDYMDAKDPEALISKFKSEELDAGASVDRFIDYALKTSAHGTVRNNLFGVKKWLSLSGVHVDWEKIEMPTTTATSETDAAPSKEQLKNLLNHASSSMDRAVIFCGTASGLRIGTLLSLKIGDVDFNYPDVARLTVERQRGRKFNNQRGGNGGRLFISWLTPEARTALQAYLKEREAQGENLKSESPLFTDAYYTGKPITVEDFERVWHRLLKRSSLDQKSKRWYIFHVHTLRKYFRSNCVGVDVSYRERWMGHKGLYLDVSYFRAEESLHLAEYRKAVAHLTIYSTEIDDKRMRSRMLVDFARLQGTPEDQLRKLEEVLARAKTVDEGITEFKRLQEPTQRKPRTIHDGNGKYLVAKSEDEMIQRLHDGWHVVQALNHDKYLLETA